MEKVLSFDIGGTSIKYGIVTTDGNVLWKSEMDTEAELGAENILYKIKEKIKKVKESEEILGVAISTAGIVDSENGVIAEANGTIKGYKGFRIKEIIEKEFDLRTTVENDVNCAALGELWRGAARGKNNVFCITIGTGVGGAVIINGKILKGNTFSTGEIGYLNIGNGKLDDLGSTSGIVSRVAKRKEIDINDINGKIIFDLAKKGDKISIEEIDNMIDKISTTISIIAYIINPEVIVLGGGITKQKDYLLPKFKESTEKKVIPYIYDRLEIRLAELENTAGMIGAVYNFLNK